MRNDDKVGLVFLVAILMVISFAIGGFVGQWEEHRYLAKKSAEPVIEAPIDPRIGADIQELSKRTVQLAEVYKKHSQQIEELYGRDEQLKAFIENLYRGAQPQAFIDKQASK